jgi:hypothetical protein
MKKLLLPLSFVLLLATGCNYNNQLSNNSTANSSPAECATTAASWYENYINNMVVKPAPGLMAGTNSYVNHYFTDSDTCYVVLHFTAPNVEIYAIYNPYENTELDWCNKWDSITKQPVASDFECINQTTQKADTSSEVEYLMQNYMGLPQGYFDPTSGNYMLTSPNPIPPGALKIDPNNP